MNNKAIYAIFFMYRNIYVFITSKLRHGKWVLKKQKFPLKNSYTAETRNWNRLFLTLSGPGGGGQYCPPDFWQVFQQKLEEPINEIFLTIPKYVYTLTLKQNKFNVSPYRLAERGVKSAGQDIKCLFWTYLHFL